MPARQPLQTNTSSNLSSVQAQSPFATRAFAPPLPQDTILNSELTSEDTQKKRENAALSGHSLSKMKVGTSEDAFPPSIQLKANVPSFTDTGKQSATPTSLSINQQYRLNELPITEETRHKAHIPKAKELQARLERFPNRNSSVQRKLPLQRQIAAWEQVEVGSGTLVYHCTDYASAKSIVDNHIQDVQNGWGGGALGAGFYTHKTVEGGINYVAEGRRKVVLKFEVSRNATGQAVKPSDYASKNGVQDNEDPVEGNDFLSNAEDANEIKWHGGGALSFKGFAIIPENDKFYENEQALEDDLGITLAGMANA